MRLMTYPVAVLINNEIRCIPLIEKDDLFEIRASYIGTDRQYSGYELYADTETGNCMRQTHGKVSALSLKQKAKQAGGSRRMTVLK